MKRSEKINRWFAVMQMIEKQITAVDKIEHDSTKEVNAIKNLLHKAAEEVDQILSCKYNT